MTNFQISVLCLIATLGIYFANKRLYRRFHALPLMPLVFTPILLVLMLVFGHISWQNYIGESHWLLWLLGPATIAFAVPVYDNLAIIRRHWMSLSAGVITATVVAVCSSVWLARLFTLPDEIQRSLAVRSVTTPFALAAAKPLGGQPDLVALFVVVTGVFGMAVGDMLFLRLSIREGMAKGAGFGAASHGAGTARSYELGQQEGVVASLVMMLSGVVMVLVAPLALQVTLRRIVGGREDPDTDKRHGNGEQRRVFIREDGAGVTEDLHPDRRAQNHQDHRRQQPQPAANHRPTGGQF